MRTYSIMKCHRTAGGSWEKAITVVESGLDWETAVNKRRELTRADHATRTRGSLARNIFQVVVEKPAEPQAPAIDPRQLNLFGEVNA